MGHQVSLVKNILTVRITGRGSPGDIQREIVNYLAKQPTSLIVILDLTLATTFEQSHKALFYRLFQHGSIERVGIASSNPVIAKDVGDLVSALGRVRKVSTAPTELDLLVKFGLADPPTQPRKLTGMLSYLRKQ